MIAIIDYGMGNLHSVSKAVERLGYEAIVTADAKEIMEADGAILPGVGAFGDAMQNLKNTGLEEVTKFYAASGKPLLGICLGMQLLFSESEEYGPHEGLGLLPGKVIRFKGDYKVPHMGWNKLSFLQDSPLVEGLQEGHVYFVHSFHAKPEQSSDLLATIRLPSAGDGDCRSRQCVRHAVSSREKRRAWHGPAEELPRACQFWHNQRLVGNGRRSASLC